mmetsp:Transcript_22532/g.70944  ORF Transcript_22532/g.70944 Transcript_22532/m.70944 type:complete len:270 (+) Transcript_22532:867-1676(+)
MIRRKGSAGGCDGERDCGDRDRWGDDDCACAAACKSHGRPNALVTVREGDNGLEKPGGKAGKVVESDLSRKFSPLTISSLDAALRESAKRPRGCLGCRVLSMGSDEATDHREPWVAAKKLSALPRKWLSPTVVAVTPKPLLPRVLCGEACNGLWMDAHEEADFAKLSPDVPVLCGLKPVTAGSNTGAASTGRGARSSAALRQRRDGQAGPAKAPPALRKGEACPTAPPSMPQRRGALPWPKNPKGWARCRSRLHPTARPHPGCWQSMQT